MARLRAFLQSLTTGEAGFMNVCVGSTAFAFALYKHQKEQYEAGLIPERPEFPSYADVIAHAHEMKRFVSDE